MKNPQKSSLCISIFKDGTRTTTVKTFTRTWTELVNRIEKGKRADCTARETKQ